MIDLPELVALLYRADWTRLSLRGELLQRVDRAAAELLNAPSGRHQDWTSAGPAPQWQEIASSVLVAPGGRFRVQKSAREVRLDLTVCDGESCWRLLGDWAERTEASLGDPELAKLLDPSWLLAWYLLELSGTGGAVATADTSGRAAYRVTARPRPARLHGKKLPGRIDALIDAELGIVLCLEASQQGRLIETTSLRVLSIGSEQALDLSRFSPPPGTTPSEPGASLAEFGQLKGPLGQVVGSAADLTAAALGFAVRHAPRPAAPPPGPPMPRPAPAEETAGAEPVSDAQLSLLQRTGLPGQNFSAEARQWIDRDVLLEQARKLSSSMPQPLTGVLGPDALWDALGQQVTGIAYRTVRLRIAMPDRYRIDFLSGNWQSKLAIACDGEHLHTRYRNRVVTSRAEPLDDDWARLADPAWLLLSEWHLFPAGDTEVNGRPGVLFWADSRRRRAGQLVMFPPGWTTPSWWTPFDRVAVVLDAELGILLRWVGYVGSRPANCVELAEVQPFPGIDPADFTMDVQPGVRVVESSSPLAHVDLRRPREAAKAAGVLGMAGAAIVSGWLQNRPGRRPPPRDDH